MALRWGIIGTGEIAWEMAYAIGDLSGSKLMALASRNAERGALFAKKLSVPTYYQDHSQLITDPEIDIVYIASPNHLHFEMIMACLEAGKHVLCEKPICIKSTQISEIEKQARDHNLFCMEANWVAFNPTIRKLIRMIRSGSLGEIRSITGSFGHDIRRVNYNEGGDGVNLNLGVYLIGFCVLAVGKPDLACSVELESATGEVEQSSIILKYNDKTLANLTCSHVCNLENTLVVSGTRSKVIVTAPFYRSGILDIQMIESDGDDTPDPQVPFVRNYYNMPWFLKYLPFLKRILSNYVPRGTFIPFKAHSYHYQLQEVSECIRRGRIQSDHFPLTLSKTVLEVVESLGKTR